MKKIFLPFFILNVFPALLMAQVLLDSAKYQKARETMVLLQIRLRGVSDKKVLNAMNQITGVLFVPMTGHALDRNRTVTDDIS